MSVSRTPRICKRHTFIDLTHFEVSIAAQSLLKVQQVAMCFKQASFDVPFYAQLIELLTPSWMSFWNVRVYLD